MSVIDDPAIERDGKAGYSTICRRGEHRTCAMAKARCSCTCHGRQPQEPPRPQEVPAMSEATVTPLPSKPVAVPDHHCDECDRSFVSAQGLALHRTRTHGPKRSAPRPPKPTPKPAAVEPANERQLLAIVAQAYHDLNGADVGTCIDSAADILDAITNAGWRIVEA